MTARASLEGVESVKSPRTRPLYIGHRRGAHEYPIIYSYYYLRLLEKPDVRPHQDACTQFQIKC